MRSKTQIFQFELCRVSFNLIFHIDFKYIMIQTHVRSSSRSSGQKFDFIRMSSKQCHSTGFSLEFLNLMLGTLDIFWERTLGNPGYSSSADSSRTGTARRIRTDSHGFARNQTDSHGFKRIQTDSDSNETSSIFYRQGCFLL